LPHCYPASDFLTPGQGRDVFLTIMLTSGSAGLSAILGGMAPEAGGGGQALLASIGQDGKTAGVLNVDGELTPLVSGRSSLGNYAASGHVEGQAALIMRETGVSKAELLIDNPNGICGYCNSQLPTLLPEGAELTVRPPLGTVPPSSRWFNGRTFIGNANDPKPWP
jgi:hypothetical protein